jgi:DNA-binding NarL/FixJ family response regulator
MMGYEPNQETESSGGSSGESAWESAEEAVYFSPKQREVFDQLMLGVPNKVIADRLNMAEGTVKTHLHSIYQILKVRNRAQAILKSRQLRLIA